ncbi:MAG: hypothetical protein HY791_03990 [Deltaproteobacteria bacterium]|nr:hypothetical protein [Deltaproteobacteria bacterium]
MTPALVELVARLRDATAGFGRMEPDLRAISDRAERDDFKGVLQNARLVAEGLLRAIVVDERKETPGKLTLDQLLTKLYQVGQPSLLPTHVAVHLRTIQAWGNVSAHDQADNLFQEGLVVGAAEAEATLHALLVILAWYRQKYLETNPSAAKPPQRRSRRALLVSASVAVPVVVGLLAAGYSWRRAREDEVTQASLDAVYLSEAEPIPPVECRASSGLKSAFLAAKLLAGGRPGKRREEDARALSLLSRQSDSAEELALLAKALLQVGDLRAEAVARRAIELCPSMASAHHALGTALLMKKEATEAEAALSKAVSLAPDWVAPRMNLALVWLEASAWTRAIGALEEVLKRDATHAGALEARALAFLRISDDAKAGADLERLLAIDPNRGSAYLLMGDLRTRMGRGPEAKDAYCKAKELGIAAARERCPVESMHP